MPAGRSRAGLLSRLGRRVRRLVAGRRDADVPATRVAAADGRDDRLVDEDFRLSIDTLRQDQAGRFQTKLQIISLVEFREAVGERWSRVAEKVMMIAEGVINTHIGAGNLFTRQGQDFFVLLFRGCPQTEGRRRALMIAQDLGVRLLGDQFIGLERPLALAAELSLADAVNDDGSFNLAAIHTAVGEMRAFLAETATQAAPGLRNSLLPGPAAAAAAEGLRRSLMPSAASPRGKAASGAPIPAAPSELERPAPAGLDPEWQPIVSHRRRAHASDDPTWEPVRTASVPAPISPSSPAPAIRRPPAILGGAAPSLPADARLSLMWRPTWWAAAEAVALYKAQIQRVDRDGEPPQEGSRAYPADREGVAALDRAVVAGAAGDLRANPAARSVLVVPLHWASVTSAQRMSITAPLAEAGRAGRVIVELFGQPADVAPRALEDAVRAVRTLGREVVLRVQFAAPLTGLAADCGCSAVGVDLADLAPAERSDDRGILAHLNGLAQGAGRARLGCYVWGVRHRRVVVGAIQGGFAMVNGSALMKDLDQPGRVLPAPKSRFVQPS